MLDKKIKIYAFFAPHSLKRTLCKRCLWHVLHRVLTMVVFFINILYRVSGDDCYLFPFSNAAITITAHFVSRRGLPSFAVELWRNVQNGFTTSL